MKDIVQDKMRNALVLDVPVEIELGIGRTWLETH
jgi:DNA polymerase I-like protein with 3'-5' exonuclease and polymerase domains